MIQLVYIPNEKIDEAWHHVESNIADALARSSGYALASNFKEWIKEKKCNFGFFGIKKANISIME